MNPEDLAGRLRGVLRTRTGGVAVALSGGIDSTVVAKAAFLELGDQAVAVTADSPSVPRAELTGAKEIAALIGIRHEVIATSEFANADYLRNGGDRCYHCKSELYDRVLEILPRLGVMTVCSGANLDDLGDYRPGLTAAAERNVFHPLQEAGFTKADVRAVAKWWNLPTWDKPASPCLSSRLAPGVAVTPERTAMIEHAETFLRSLGLNNGRVRLHEGELARIEVPLAEVARLAAPGVRETLSRTFHELGFRFVTLDLEGFRSGSLNDLVPLEMRTRHAPERRTTS
ncbi:ATP-dependent sacrificial sulfur transferase LarE [Zavarzinella formosa]|uniref:ATP-dependent sacrificial sulfur transferase LarE n=1 Tax=Zavarzinella formosa TaxID=360055 RepID=UPI000314FA9E|nr:ATP-dependent sacrificial sulfur transferase LarE [Zavarzinella formosa]